MKKEKVPSTYKYNDITCNDTGERVHDYNTYMLTEHWKVLRERIAYNKNYKCDICGKHVKMCFQVHHKTYKHVGNELDNELSLLCIECHENLHTERKLAQIAKKRHTKKTHRNYAVLIANNIKKLSYEECDEVIKFIDGIICRKTKCITYNIKDIDKHEQVIK